MALTQYEIQLLEQALDKSMNNEKLPAKREEDYLAYGGYEPFTIRVIQLLNKKAGIGWTTYSHTGTPVITYAIGAGPELFYGYYDNTDIFKKMKILMKD